MEGERGKSVSGAQHNVQHWMGEEFSMQGFAQSTVDEKVELHPVGHVPNHTEDSITPPAPPMAPGLSTKSSRL